MGNTSQKARHISGDDTGPSLTAGRFVDGNFDADPYTGYGQGVAYQKRARAATASQTEVEESKQRLLPTVFKWEGGGKEVFLTGSFNNWKTKIPLVKSHGDFYTIVDLPEGDHQYKFYVDGQWVHDSSEPAKPNSLGTLNNVMRVKQSDFEVFEALDLDSLNSPHIKSDMLPDHNMLGVCPNPWYQMLSDPGPYPHQLGHSLQVPEMGDVCSSPSDEYGQDIPVRRAGEKLSGPPILPPHLLQVLLNKDTPAHCEPTLLPEPNHVMLNHLYALSIKDGVMVLSATHRFRKKYVTTLLYKPI